MHNMFNCNRIAIAFETVKVEKMIFSTPTFSGVANSKNNFFERTKYENQKQFKTSRTRTC